MDIAWHKQGKYLVASVDCRGEPSHSGGTGWYQVGVQEWICNWKLRLEISVTQPKPGCQCAVPAGSPARDRPGAWRFLPDNDSFLDVIVDNDIVEVWFPVPDCIQPLKKTFGCAGGTTIALAGGSYRCQARLITKAPDFTAYLRRAGPTLEFIQTNAGHTNVIGVIENWMAPPDWPALMKALSGAE